MSIDYYRRIICKERLFPTKTHREINEEFTSDKTRIVFSSPFRRLQSKAQVFSLETNAAVRSRLTHTLEVATIGVSIAEKITVALRQKNLLDDDLVFPFVKIVENACLLHDIGNPPFGHFAEESIKKWFVDHWKNVFKDASGIQLTRIDTLENINTLVKDFLHFDGNPQGVRIVTKLQDFPNSFAEDCGLNLTYSQISSIIKYIVQPSDLNKTHHLTRKPGYFHSEAEKIHKIKNFLKIETRFPLTYIMEAADDISYCLSDIEDGIEKKVITSNYFFEKLEEECAKIFNQMPNFYSDLIIGKTTREDFFTFKIEAIRSFEKHAIKRYLDNHENIIGGNFSELIDKASGEGKLLNCLKVLSRKYLFRSREVENKELAGYHAILGLLEKFRILLEIDYKRFNNLVTAKDNLDNILGSGLDLHWRLFNMLPEKYVESYKIEFYRCQEKYKSEEIKLTEYEWFYRAHLIVDYIAGMTDNYVIETYNILHGITL